MVNEKDTAHLPDAKIPDLRQQWRNYLSHGQWNFTEELLTPNTELLTPGIALLLSPDGSKRIVLGDAKNDSLDEYDEGDRVAYVSFCNGGSGTPFLCPECGQSYVIALDEHKRARERFPPSDGCDHTISIPTTARLFDCTCGVVFALSDRYEFLRLPFFLVELELLHCLFRMSRTADLFVRYVLSPDGQTVVEEVGVVTQHTSQDVSLTSTPGFRFLNWGGSDGTGPSFISDSFRAYDVQIWRTRTYRLGADTFEEKTYHGSQGWCDTVWRKVKDIPDLSGYERLRDSLQAGEEARKKEKKAMAVFVFSAILMARLGVQDRSDSMSPQEEIDAPPIEPQRGGDRRPEAIKRLWAWTGDDCKRFVELVEDLIPACGWLKTNYDSRFVAPLEWVASVRQRSQFPGYFSGCKKLTDDLLLRVTDTTLSEEDRQPLSLAVFYAANELDVLKIYLQYMNTSVSTKTLKRNFRVARQQLLRSEQANQTSPVPASEQANHSLLVPPSDQATEPLLDPK